MDSRRWRWGTWGACRTALPPPLHQFHPSPSFVWFETDGTIAVKNVLHAPFFKTSVTFERNEIRQKSQDQIHRCLQDLTILFRTFLTYNSPFQSYGDAKKLDREILLWLLVQKLSIDYFDDSASCYYVYFENDGTETVNSLFWWISHC